MYKAFIFDLDGVIIDSESQWQIENEDIFAEVYGPEVGKKLGSMIGMSMKLIHEQAEAYGSNTPFTAFVAAVQDRGNKIYSEAPIAPNIQDLMAELKLQKYKLGLVSASPIHWIEIVLRRLNWDNNDFQSIISLHEREDLGHKPSPEGYITAITDLGVRLQETFILEDSNLGIQAGKAAGATVIGFQQFLLKGYRQEGADIYAKDMLEVLKIVKNPKESNLY